MTPLAQRLKRLPSMRETRVRPLGQEDPLEKKMASPASYSPGSLKKSDPTEWLTLMITHFSNYWKRGVTSTLVTCRAGFMAVYLGNHTRPHIQKGPTLSLMLYCHYADIHINFIFEHVFCKSSPMAHRSTAWVDMHNMCTSMVPGQPFCT